MLWPTPLLVATHNPGKLEEWHRLLRPLGVEVRTPRELELPEPVEPEPSFAGNAMHKARHGFRHSGVPTLADDTGFCVEALGGGPGVRTARFVAEIGGWPLAYEEFHRAVTSSGDERVALHCALALVVPGLEFTASAVVEGRFSWPPDPAMPGGAAVMRAESPLFEGSVMLHRRRAFAGLRANVEASAR